MQFWEDFLKAQEKKIGKSTVEKWLRPIKVVRFDAGNLYLEVNDSFQAMWFEEHIKAKVQNEIFSNNKKVKVHIKIKSQQQHPQLNHKNRNKANPIPQFSLNCDDIDEHMSLENFICSEQNMLAYKLLAELKDYFGKENNNNLLDIKSLNPIFIHGKTGSGKSHLLMSVAKILKSLDLSVIYTKTETFTNNVVRAIRAAEMQKFRRLYRHVDVLIMDDIEILSGKVSTQEEFFHTFNSLHLDNKLIILSANCSPTELKDIEPRLVSRFEWGISLALEELEKEHFKTLLEYKSKEYNFIIDNKLQNFLIENFSRNTLSLTKAIESLALRAQLEQDILINKTIYFEKAAPFLRTMLDEEKLASITPIKIIKAVAEHYNIEVKILLSKTQQREISNPRKLAMYLCRKKLDMPYSKIGAIFSRDHSTVISNIRYIDKKIKDNDTEVIQAFRHISIKL